MLSLRIAVRFLKKSPAQTVLIILGISVGIAVQIFIGSLISSLQAYLIDTTLGSSPHLVITSAQKDRPVVYDSKLKSTLTANSNIKHILPQRTVSAIAKNGLASTPLTIRSGDSAALDAVYNITPKIVKGVYILNKNEIVVGQGFADKYNLLPGRQVSLQLAGNTIISLKVTGIADYGNKQLNESIAYTNAAFGEAALGLQPDEYSSINVQLKNVFNSTKDASSLEKAVSAVSVTDWQVEQKDLLSGLQAQSSSTFMIQFFVIVAVALGIASTLSISAIQKTRQIGILKALGFSDSRSGGVFLWQGAILGVLGSLGGLLLGLGLIAVFQLTAGSKAGSFPITPQAQFIVISVAIGIAVSMVSAILPSRRTAKLDPIEVIQSGG
jgi:lipoprotein-releasing system permease protein